MGYKDVNSFVKDWTKALRSGEYEQGKGVLRRVGVKKDTYCCLGVAADLLVKNGHQAKWMEGNSHIIPVATKSSRGGRYGSSSTISGVAPRWLQQWLMDKEGVLVHMNDRVGATFTDIAEWLEGQL